MSATSKGGKRKAPMSVSAGILSSEQAGQRGGAPSTSSKRTRFEVQATADEDVDGDLDIEEQDRKRNQQGRKGRVVTDGYDSEEEDEVAGFGSDSEEEEGEEGGEGQGDGAHSNGKVAGAVDEDDDMFNLSDDHESKASTAVNKGKKFLGETDIEGQELSEYESEGDAEFQLESEEDEDVEGTEQQQLADPDAVVRPLNMKKRKGLIRKRKDGAGREDSPDMGFQMERFNMKNEMATGRFDEQGNYVANARDPHAEHDSWLTGQYNRKTISAARTAQLRREKELRAQEAKRDTAKLDEDECKMRLAGLLRRSESVLEAIQRLGNEVKKMKKKRKEDTGEQSEASNAKSELDRLTSISSELMSRYGRANIYDVTYEELLRDVRRSGLVRETWDPAAANEKPSDQWLYRWSPAYLAATAGQDAEEKGEHFGPFTREDLHAWQDAGYFGEGGERIVLMPSGDEGQKKEWRSWAEAFLQ